MKKTLLTLICTVAAAGMLLTGCGSKTQTPETKAPETEAVQTETESETETEAIETEAMPAVAALEDGVYCAEFNTDSSMFHINEALDGKCELIVQDGAMTAHITLTSQNILNLYLGLAEDAEKEGAELLEPVLDTVTYEDGLEEVVNGFFVPVPVLEEEFDLALIGKKGVWYDHKVSVNNPVLVEE